jgi:hypothetical protein
MLKVNALSPFPHQKQVGANRQKGINTIKRDPFTAMAGFGPSIQGEQDENNALL